MVNMEVSNDTNDEDCLDMREYTFAQELTPRLHWCQVLVPELR